jgi:hypothetical protein
MMLASLSLNFEVFPSKAKSVLFLAKIFSRVLARLSG